MIRLLANVTRTADRSILPLSSSLFRPPPAAASPQLCLAGLDCDGGHYHQHLDDIAASDTSGAGGGGLFDALWLAVPKSRKTKGKKRMKTTVQKRIPKKANIVTDARTGEPTLMHKLPFNWKDYLPPLPVSGRAEAGEGDWAGPAMWAVC